MDIQEYYIYKPSRQPTVGWLQQCFCCETTFTSKVILFSSYKSCHYKEKYWSYICDNCEYNISNDIVKFINFSKKCKKFIKENCY